MVVNVGYRSSLDYKFPTQANDAWDAFNWVYANAERIRGDKTKIIAGGISAGGNLVAGLCQRDVIAVRYQSTF